MEKPDKLHLSQVIKVNMTSDKSCDENGTIIIAGHSTKHPTGTLQSCQGHQKQGTSEKWSQSRGA